jgi:type VI secretion system protein ImpC
MHFSINLGREQYGKNPRKSVKGFSIVVLGEFAGNAETDNPLIAETPLLHSVDIDTFDKLVAKLKPSLTLSLDGDTTRSLTLNFERLEDFHPDGIVNQLGDYRLLPGEETDTGGVEASADEYTAESRQPAGAESEESTLSRLLGERPLSVERDKGADSTLSAAKKSMIEDVVRRLAENATVSKDSVPSDSQSADESNEASKSRVLRSLLHHRAFQELEANWRALDWLLHSTEPDPAVRFHVLNIPRSALAYTRSNHSDPTASPLYHKLWELVQGVDLSESDFILIDNHAYGPRQEDMAMLDWLGSLIERFDGILLAGSDSSFMGGDDDLEDAFNEWQAFRKRPSAARISLLYPQVLLRLPYGAATDPVHSLPFEELQGRWTLEDLLWGNPAYAQLIMMINQWTNQGETDQPHLLTDLPAYSYQSDGEQHLQPCAKHLLNERQIEHLLKLGIVPVIGSRNRNTIQIPWYQQLRLATDV